MPLMLLFHFVSNIKKAVTPIINSLKKLTGKRSPHVLQAEKLKRVLMMLPLLPIETITPENVYLLFRLMRPSCRERASDLDDLYSYIINTYVARNARFPKQIWCVCGQAIRTNNAVESSHATLNTFVRVNGAVSLDVFLFAIER